MPNGRVMRIDEDRECAYVVRRGRSIEASLSEVEPAARVPGARVRYRLRRDHGVERAERVELRSGTRTNKRQRRFGDLTGAHSPGSKVPTGGQKAYGIDVSTQPFRVVEAWISAMSDQDLDGAASLYLPGATLDVGGRPNVGRIRIRAELEACSWVGVDEGAVEMHGIDRYVRVDRSGGEPSPPTHFVIEQGHIAEQWIDSEPESEVDEGPETAIRILTKGSVGTDDRAYAEKRLEHLLETQGTDVGFARMKLEYASGSRNETPARAEITLDLDGTLIRAHAVAPTMTEGIDQAVKRLHHNLDRRHSRRQDPVRFSLKRDDGWRHGALPSTHPPGYERPAEDREIVRHKSFAPDEMTVDEAAWDMALLDYDFFLFVELATGQDCLLERRDGGELLIHLLAPSDGPPPPSIYEGLPTSPSTAATMKPSEAIQLLDGADWPFVFFRNPTTDRGNVIYRRYDGHYGLITPPAEFDDAGEEGGGEHR